MKKTALALLMTLGVSISPYCMAETETTTQSGEEIFVDIVGSICEREGFDTMVMRQAGETPEATQEHINTEVIQPLQQSIQQNSKIDPNLAEAIIDLSTAFSQVIVQLAWADDTNVIKEQVTQYGTTDLTQEQQDAIWEKVKTHAIGFSAEMKTMCESEVYEAIPSLRDN